MDQGTSTLTAEPGTVVTTCEVCGNTYDKAFQVIAPAGGSRARTFDSFECAIHAMAPACAHCACRVIGHGVEEGEQIYCCANCAREAGAGRVRDRV